MVVLLVERLRRELALARGRPDKIFIYTMSLIGYVMLIRETMKSFGLLAAILLILLTAGFLFFITRIYRFPPVDAPPAETSPEPAGPRDRRLPVLGSTDRVYSVKIPTSAAVAYEIMKKSQDLFGEDAIDPDEDMQAFLGDPYSLTALQDEKGNIFGFIDYYAFDEDHFRLFLNGDYTFDNLLADGLLNHPQARTAKVLYLATIVNFSFLLDSMARERTRQNGILIWAALANILAYQEFPEEGLDLYSIGWGKGGISILKIFGLQPVGRVMKGKAEGKWIHARKGVKRADLERICEQYRRRYEHWCSLQILPASPAALAS
ncbi:hypothetical protein [Rhizobium binxianense]